MRITRMAVVASAAAALALGGLTACGEDELKSNAGTDAKALADESLALLKQVDDFKMTGTGKDTEDNTSMEWDICIRKGADLVGNMKMDGSPVEMIKVGNDLYMKADAAFWSKTMGGEEGGPSEMGKLMAGKYMKTPADDEDGPFDPTDFFDGSTDGVTKGEAVKIDGRKLIPLAKKDEDGVTTTLFVPEKGKPYPVLVKTDDGSAEMRFSKGKNKCEPAVPPADQVVDAEALSKFGAS
ncbi:hypothetical protein [Embleya sp. NPDC001921]